MSFDRTTRNALARMVGQVRELLKFDVMDQLRRLGFQADGCVLDLEQIAGLSELENTGGRELRDLLEHFVALESGPVAIRRQAAYDRLAREIGFTTLNRFVALRMAEERGLIVQTVGHGLSSDGFQIYERVARDALGNRAETYRAYLECLYDELALDLPMLFDRTTPESRIFPSERCLEEVLSLLNDASLAHLWKEDEAIGWVYQYYNDPVERKKMREALAPRNSRELAVRNQFFTPRYVVEFLTDNTLGRLWYEMRQGNTQLSNQCRYLVRRPVEILLQDGEEPPQSVEPEEDFGSEELLNRPVFIPFRVKKDPRDLKILDPACGSGHFLLYTFDLLETIYEEAWADSASPISVVTCTRLRNDYTDLDALRRALPGLILRYNLYGVDIDPRACQIAGLALWLRSQRSYQSQRLLPADRPQITKSNIVCAEPMPGEREFLEEYLKRHVDQRLHDLVRIIWEKMQLAGEAGTLLKIEQAIEVELARARERAMIDISPVRVPLFQQGNSVVQERMTFSTSEERAFWSEAEQKLLAALSDYPMQAPNGHVIQRRLFAEDAVQGFAFIDLCRSRFDVALMNPPFGLGVPEHFETLNTVYPDTYVDMYATFVVRGIELAPQGFVGSITSRAFLTTKKLERWRRNSLIARLEVLVDLGSGIMDDAYVETCAYVSNGSPSAKQTFPALNVRPSEAKPDTILRFARNTTELGYSPSRVQLLALPGAKILYALPEQVVKLLHTASQFEPSIGTARQGMTTFDDPRFLRLRWEVLPQSIGRHLPWEPLAKGGEFARYYSDIHLLVGWKNEGAELAEVNRQVNGQVAQSRQASTYYYRPGATYSKRSAKGFSARAFPAGCIFSAKGPVVLPESEVDPAYIVAWLNTRLIRSLIHLQANFFEFNTGIIKTLPWYEPDPSDYSQMVAWAKQMIDAARRIGALLETDSYFQGWLGGGTSLAELSCNIVEAYNADSRLLDSLAERFDEVIDKCYGVRGTDVESAVAGNGEDLEQDSDDDVPSETVGTPTNLQDHVVKTFVSQLLGLVMGRWDVRVLSLSVPVALPDIFSNLPIISPAILVGPDDLPARPGCIVSEEWLRARPDAISLPPVESVRQPTIPDEEYPIHIAWDGILVDDPEHPSDIARRVREVLTMLWPGENGVQAEVMEREVCEILGVKNLQEYFRRQTAFFANHLKQYSQSRRQAPIYWPLSTASGSYTLWIYYHRLTSDTLFTAVNQYVEPKFTEIQRKIGELEGRLTGTSGHEATRLREEIEDARAFLAELQRFRAELLRVAALPYRPNLNDGVIINAAPLHRLFRFPKWAKDTKECWEKLQRGKYDWAYMAYTIWPDRVREKVRVDRSFAIAHDLEHLYLEQPIIVRGKRSRKAVPDKEDEK